MNSRQSVAFDEEKSTFIFTSEFLHRDYFPHIESKGNLVEALMRYSSSFSQITTSTNGFDECLSQCLEDISTNSELAQEKLLISDLGWSKDEALETYLRLSPFTEDWDAPGMESYDAL